MAGLQRHPSLRFSVFELAADIGLEAGAFDGNFDAIAEEDEQPTSPAKRQRRTHSSDELTDSSFPLTPPSSNIALYSPRPLNLANKKIEDHPRFGERFPTRSPDLISTTPKPTTPKSGNGKLRKNATAPATNTPALELLLDFTDSERDRPRKDKKKALREEKQDKEREKFAKGLSTQRDKSRDAAHRTPPQSPPNDEEEKKLLGGLLRFRTRSKERKAAAKEAVRKVSMESQASMPPPTKPQTPPPLPIATRFARPREEISFRPLTSESSHGGHGSNYHSQTGSSETHDVYPRPRDRSSRFERPHPVWRSGPSTLGNIGNAAVREDKGRVLPAEIHALPPNQSIFDREPAKRPARIEIPSGGPGNVDMEAVNKYYGITPEPAYAPPPPAATPVPQSHLALAQALEPIDTRPSHQLKPSHSTVGAPSAPSSPSPFLVPSPHPAQSEFGVQVRAKRGRMNIPPALDPTFVLPKRIAGAFNPPPTPPPTMDLPPIPTHLTDEPSSHPLRMYSPAPPSAMRSPSTLPLKTRTSNPNLRVEPSTPSPLSPAYLEKPGTPALSQQESAMATGLGMAPPPSPLRSLSPVQRGKTPAFPARPVTPTKPPPASPLPASPRPRSANRNGSGGSGVGSNGGPYPSHRREYDPSVPAAIPRSRKSSVTNEERILLRPTRSQQQLSQKNEEQYSMPSGLDMLAYTHGGADAAPPPARKRSLRKSNYNQSGYDSDDASSRYSRDTYYGRDTAYFDDSNLPPLPHLSDMPPLPQRDFGDMEQERKAGRERLVRMLANGGRDI